MFFELIMQNNGLGIRNVIRQWIPEHLTNAKWTLVQVMAGSRQATNHYMA